MFDTRSLKNRIHNSIHAAEDLLIKMAETPAQSPPQITLHVGYLKKMSGLTYKVENDLFDIDNVCGAHNNDAELEDLSASMSEIGRSASTIYKELCTREEFISNANIELLHARQNTHEDKDPRTNSTADLSRLITKSQKKIQTMEVLLATIPKPALDLIQKQERDKKIRRINILMITAHSDTLEIKDDIDATNTNNLESSIASIRHRIPTIYAEDTPWEHHHTAGTKTHTQTKPAVKNDYLRSVLRPRRWTPSPGAHHITTKNKTYRAPTRTRTTHSKLNKPVPRCGPPVPKLAARVTKHDGNWTTMLETTNSYQARKLLTPTSTSNTAAKIRIGSLRGLLHTKTHNAEALLETIMTPTQNPCYLTSTEVRLRVGCIIETSKLTYEADKKQHLPLNLPNNPNYPIDLSKDDPKEGTQDTLGRNTDNCVELGTPSTNPVNGSAPELAKPPEPPPAAVPGFCIEIQAALTPETLPVPDTNRTKNDVSTLNEDYAAVGTKQTTIG